MWPGTIINPWHDESAFPEAEIQAVDNSPLFLIASAFDRGPEFPRVVEGDTFYKLYGSKMNFRKYGQPAIQAAHDIDNGGRLLIKRVVASDAKLANVIILANVTNVMNLIESTDDDAMSMDYFITGTDNPTASMKYKKVSSNIVLKYTTQSIQNTVEPTEVFEAADNLGSFTDFDPNTATTVSTYTDGSGNVIEVTYDSANAQYVDKEGNVVLDDTGVPVTAIDVIDAVSLSSVTVIPLIVITDNGRGVSDKTVKITPDYITSKDYKNFFYNIAVFSGSNRLDSIVGSINPDCFVNSKNYGLNEFSSIQVIFHIPEGAYSKLKEALAPAPIDQNKLDAYDLINALTSKKVPLSGIEIDPDSIDLNSAFGIKLEDGDNGEFGDAPFGTQAYSDALEWFFYPDITRAEDNPYEIARLTELQSKYDYENSNIIFDLDDFKIAACFDANYPMEVKKAITDLANFRQDFFFFRDYGLDVASYQSIIEKHGEFDLEKNSYFVGDYFTTYQIYDPYEYKRIRVTMMYDLSSACIGHFRNGAFRPVAGIINNIILESVIEGTINFCPRITPSVNQKSLLEDARINYALFNDDQCVVQSLYTSQEPLTQLTYINNVLAIQEVIRDVREACPKNRYKFVVKSDFTEYAKDVNTVLQDFVGNFAELQFDYQQDPLKGMQKIFYAVLKFRFNNWAQTEVFDIYALPDEL